jgi:hypothetical protein
MQTVRWFIVASMSLALAGCGGGGGKQGGGTPGGGGGSPTTFTLGGAVTGLSGSLVLQANGGNDLTLNASGAFTFTTALASGAAYSVAIKTQPQNQTCTVTNGSGTIAANVSNVAVACVANAANTFTVSGTISGLAGAIVLQNSGGSDLPLTTNGAFTFGTPVVSGGAYAVSVKTQPANQSCTVANGAGTVTANVSNVAVTCTTNAPNTFSVSGAVSGLPASSSVVVNNLTTQKTVAGGSTFEFGNLPSGAAYGIGITTQPSYPAYDCGVANGSGTIGNANVTVSVTCTALHGAAYHAITPNVKSVDVQWDAPDAGAATVNLYASTAPCNFVAHSCTPAATFNPALRSAKLSGLANGVSYSVYIETTFANGARDVTAATTAVPGALHFDGGAVKAIAVADDGKVYLGGDFTQVTISGIAWLRPHLVALDADGSLLPWAPSVTVTTPGDPVTVNALQILGDALYVGGQFTNVNGSFAKNLTALKRSDGSSLRTPSSQPWTADANSGDVRALSLVGNTLYVGGQFTAIKGVTRWNLAAVDASTAAVSPDFIPDPSQGFAAGFVNALAPAAVRINGVIRNVLYVGGFFRGIDSIANNGNIANDPNPIFGLAQVEGVYGFAIPESDYFNGNTNSAPYFQPNPGNHNGTITAIAIPKDAAGIATGPVYVAGTFNSIRGNGGAPGTAGAVVHDLASVYFDDGVALTLPLTGAPYFAPHIEFDGPFAMALAGNYLYVGGNFVGDTNVPDRLMSVPLAIDGSGSPTTNFGSGLWIPGPNPTTSSIKAIVTANNKVYVGGSFDSLTSAPACQNFCVLDPITGGPAQ